MSLFKSYYQINKAFRSLGIWFIPLLSTPIILQLILIPALTPSSSPTNTSQTPASKPLSNANIATVSRWESSTTGQSGTTHSSDNKTNKPKTQHKPQAKATKQVAATRKNPKPKKVAKQYTPPALEIRVAIARDVDSLTIGSSTTASVVATDGKLLQKLPASQAFNVLPNQSSIILGNGQLPAAVWIYPNKGGAVYVGDRWYRGKLLLLLQEGKLLAVNYVDLEQYLTSVVGSEMHPGAPKEALKAQAVAARSYALVHLVRPATSWYNLGATQRWQVYKGMNSEYNTTQKAVKDTAGQILSYKGGIVESLYAATDEIVDKAHGGVGMSQTGAYQLATQGYNYLQILGYYYPGAATARLEDLRSNE